MPASWRWLKSDSTAFVEFFGRQGEPHDVLCRELDYTKATCAFPTMEGGKVHPSVKGDTYGTCKEQGVDQGRISVDKSAKQYVVETGVSNRR